MEPWQILGDIVGWSLIAILATFMILIAWSVVAGIVNTFTQRKRGKKNIYSGRRND